MSARSSNFVLEALVVLALAGAAAAQLGRLQTRKLSAPMVIAPEPSSEVLPLFDPSGMRILYLVILTDGDDRLLASAPSDQSASPVLLTPLGGPDVRAFAWTLDGTRAVYSAGPSSSGDELYVVPAGGSASPLRIVPGVGGTPDHDITSFALAGDGTHVVYLKLLKLYGVPLDGSTAPVLLSGSATVTGFSLVGALALYVAGGHLYEVPVDGSAAPLQLSTAASEPVTGFLRTDDGLRAVYRAGSTLWSVPLDASSAPLALTPGLPAFTSIQVYDETGGTIVYLADVNENERYELFSVPVDGSASPALLVGVPTGGDVLQGFRFSPDGARVVYRANTGSPIATGLFSTALVGGATDQLFADDIGSFEVAPDSSRVVFSHAPGFQLDELHTVPLAGGADELLTPPFVPSLGEVDAFHVTADSLQVVYLADAETWDVHELYAVPIVPSGPPSATKLSPPLANERDVSSFLLAPDASHVVLTADAFERNQTKLFRAELSGAPDPAVFTTPLPSARLGDVYDYAVQNGRVVYAADQETDGQVELFGVPADGSRAPVRLSGTLVAGGDVAASPGPVFPSTMDGRITSDGALVGYLADAEVDGRTEAYVAATDGSSAPVKLNGPLTSGTSVEVLLMSPDGTRWVYSADEQANPGPRLYSVPIGGGTATALASLASTFVRAAISPDSSRVIYVNARLYSVPILGGTAVALSQASLQIQDFEITPSSARVVFRANASGAPSLRLYSSALTAGPQIVLSPVAVSGGNVTAYTVTADSARVLFLGDLQLDEHFLLYSVSSSSSPATLLHDPQLEAVSFQTAGSHVAFELLEDHGFYQDALFVAARLDGSDAHTLLTDAFDDDSTSYLLTAEGESVAIGDDTRLRLFPVDGGSPLQLYSGSAVPQALLPGQARVGFYAAGERRSVPLTGGTPLVHPVTALAGKLEFQSARAWTWLGEADEPGVVELYTSFYERVAEKRLP